MASSEILPIAPGAGFWAVDAIQVQEVLINLITNAIEAMEGSACDPRLIIRALLIDEKYQSR
jgi:C4-dicarboxylate-specific signal transduction histidine kinase